MNEQEKFDKQFLKNPHPVATFSQRPHLSRRRFMNIAGTGVTASWLASKLPAASIVSSTPVTTVNKARNVIFILLAGAPSHTDTFDFKVINGTTPATFAPDTANGVTFPAGLMPKLAATMDQFAIVRSMQAWALVHSLAQTWTQIGRNPAGVLGNVSPNIGSVVAIEKNVERTANQVFPTFLALNSAGAAGPGYFPASYAPFKVTPSNAGLKNTTNPDGQTRFNARWDFLHHLDDPLREDSPYGTPLDDFDQFYTAANGMMYNPAVTNAFKFSTADSVAYGNTSFGNACVLAKQALAANQGTRYVEITLGGWDMHVNIYAQNQLPTLAKTLDNGLSQLMTDLKAQGLLDETLIVMAGEFGRTVGKLTGAAGRDHYSQQFAFFAGAGITGGKTIGATDATGANTVDFGWSRQRLIKPEDIEATIYSAMNINWTTVRHDDPLGRGFYYVPSSDQDVYGPINELWQP
ncbi:MAG TPA: DUF1501 domain-containing protein [Bryobacteraceae bacterium]|nr:DUF1501 domain-containing protein [Bryobacteraceae bacterium]